MAKYLHIFTLILIAMNVIKLRTALPNAQMVRLHRQHIMSLSNGCVCVLRELDRRI